MKITDVYGKLSYPVTAGASKTGAKTDVSRDSIPAVSSDMVRVTVSPQARELSLKAEAQVNQAKVEKLRGAVESGTLSVDSRHIAGRLIEGGLTR
jgi:flagellar biosynthesis anti-sigma factor FlgM